jgi:hypothetical protein
MKYGPNRFSYNKVDTIFPNAAGFISLSCKITHMMSIAQRVVDAQTNHTSRRLYIAFRNFNFSYKVD